MLSCDVLSSQGFSLDIWEHSTKASSSMQSITGSFTVARAGPCRAPVNYCEARLQANSKTRKGLSRIAWHEWVLPDEFWASPWRRTFWRNVIGSAWQGW